MHVVLFDIDHTIMASPEGANARASQKMFQEVFGVSASEDNVEKVGMTEWGVIEKVLTQSGLNALPEDDVHRRIPEKAYVRWADIFEEEIRDKPSMLLPGIWEILVALADRSDVKLGLFTGNSYWRSEVKLKAVGVDSFFRERSGQLVGAFGNEARTREGLIAFAMDRLVFDNDEITLFDDSLIGAQMLKGRREISSVFVATGTANEEQLSQYAQFVLPDLDEDRWKMALEIIN